MDEVSLLIDIIDTNWTSSASALESAGYITSSHVGKPNLVDVRSLTKNRGVRYDLSSGDVIVFFEDSQNIEYNTVHFDVRNETYGFTMHIRTVHDERAGGSEDFGRERLRALYLIARHALESARRGYTASDGSKFNQIFVGSRTESNDRSKRLFGYKLSIEAKRFALTVP
ncbi:MAG: hypothetical protein CL833_02785 [Crocinitomicaceae bacterium]|nr:hypothetical protein [Crocinitomicaceae bacterium]